MRIIELHSENVMGIEAIDVTPERHINTVGGDNGQGKSSLLNSMVMALGGKSAMPAEPLRRGTDKGNIRLVIERDEGNLIVERTIGKNGKTGVVVSSADGAKFPKPQAMLDSLIGAIGFDPYAFTRLDAKKQAEQLRSLVGLDFSELDAERAALYSERTEVNRDASKLKAALDATPKHDDVPAEEVSVSDLVKELEAAQATNRAKHDAESEARKAEQGIGEVTRRVSSLVGEVKSLEEELAEAKERLAEAEAEKEKAVEHATQLGKAAQAMPTVDCEPIHERFKQVETTNAKVRDNAARKKLAGDHDAHVGKSEALSEKINQIDADKQRQLESAPWPVEGLGFADGVVTFRGIPFDQCSSAEQLRVSLAMGMAANPKLKVLIIRDGSLIGTKAMEIMRQQVEEKDFQVWVEKVTDSPEGCSLFISEGKAFTEPLPT